MDHCKKIEWFDEVDSTNTRLFADKESKPSGTVYCALSQNNGKGQRGNRWESRKGENLTFSVLFRPESIPADRQFVISQASALSVSEYLKGIGIASSIKWPNDIYVKDSKICGILIEHSVSGSGISSAVIGIGLNLNQTSFPDNLRNATSAALLSGKKFDIRAELETLTEILLGRLREADTSAGREIIAKEYLDNLYRRNEWHRYIDRSNCDPLTATTEKVDGTPFTGRITGVAANGCAIVEDKKTGEERLFAFKELSYII